MPAFNERCLSNTLLPYSAYNPWAPALHRPFSNSPVFLSKKIPIQKNKKNLVIFVVWLCNEVSGHFQKKICLKLTKQHGTVHYSAPVRQCVTSIYRPAYKYLPYYTDPPIVPPLKSDTPRIARQHVEPSQYLARPTSIAKTTPGILCCAQLNRKATVPLHYEN